MSKKEGGVNNDADYAASWAFRALAQLQDAQRALAAVWIRGHDHTTGNIGDEVVTALQHTRAALAELEKIHAITGRPASEIANESAAPAPDFDFDPDEPISREAFLAYIDDVADMGLTGRQAIAVWLLANTLRLDGGYLFKVIGNALQRQPAPHGDAQ